MKQLLTPISPGELLDKITILEIKSKRIDCAQKRSNVNNELKILNNIWLEAVSEDAELAVLRKKLKTVNEALWVIEDDIRDEERAKRFGEHFIKLARSVYVTNDKRAQLKKRVNQHLDSPIVEEKSYKEYN